MGAFLSRRAARCAAALCTLTGTCSTLSGQCDLAKFLQPGGGPEEYFGHSVSIDGTAAAIAAIKSNYSLQGAGAVFMYRRSGQDWSLESVLTRPERVWNGAFGTSVAVQGDVTVVGTGYASPQAPQSGELNVYRYDQQARTWDFEAALIQPGAGPGDQLGNSVAVHQDLIIGGARFTDLPGLENTGAAFIYRHDGSRWLLDAHLQQPEPLANDIFGRTVTIHNDLAAAGAPNAWPQPGRAVVYRYDRGPGAWVLDAVVLAPDGQPGDRFGHPLVVRDEFLAVGAPVTQDLGVHSGSVYLFRRGESGWVFKQKLLAPDGGPGNAFGSALAMTPGGKEVLVGAWGGSGVAPGTGAAYLFRFTGSSWAFESKFIADDGVYGDVFGFSVAIDGDFGLVGAKGAEFLGYDSGAAYFISGMKGFKCCYANCTKDLNFASGHILNIDDFLCFQTRFALGDPYADCDNNGALTIDDFLCFQTRFALGCG